MIVEVTDSHVAPTVMLSVSCNMCSSSHPLAQTHYGKVHLGCRTQDYLALITASSITIKHNSFKFANETSEILTVWISMICDQKFCHNWFCNFILCVWHQKIPRWIKPGTAGHRKHVALMIPQKPEIIRRPEFGKKWEENMAPYNIALLIMIKETG